MSCTCSVSLRFTRCLWKKQKFKSILQTTEDGPLQCYELVNALKTCCRTRDLEFGERIHETVRGSGFESGVFVASTLVNLYSKCKKMEMASQIFREMSHKNVVTWTCLMLGYVENGEHNRALEVFDTMDCQPDDVTYVAVLKALTRLAGERDSYGKNVILERGKLIHEGVKARGFSSDVALVSALVELYCKCRVMGLAKEVFDQMPRKDVVTWTSLIWGYVENGESFIALELFDNMDCEADVVTLVAAIKACSHQLDVQKGERIHERIRKLGLERNNILSNTLLDMYVRCGWINHARDYFNEFKNKDVVAWTCLIMGYVENGDFSGAFELFTSMDCQPNEFTYTAVLKACTSLEMGKDICREIIQRRFQSDVILSNAVIEMYGRCGDMKLARKAFEEMEGRNVATFTCLMTGYVKNGESSEALRVFHSMDCQPDKVCYVAALKACVALAGERNTDMRAFQDTVLSLHEKIQKNALHSNAHVASGLVELYGKLGDMRLARESFEEVPVKDVFLWNSLLQGYLENGESSVALDLFVNRIDCQPNHVTYTLVLKACGNLVAVPFGRLVHATICRLGLEDEAALSTTLIDFYGKSGWVTSANQVFDSMSTPGIVSWSALLAGYSSLGDTSRVFGVVREILEAGLQLDGVTFVCLLAACSHAGMVEDGERCFRSMQGYGVRPSVEHYNCLVDMLGRANKVEQAVGIIESMRFEVDQVTWMAVLNACRRWKDLEAGRVAFDALVSGNKSCGAPFVLMSDIYCTKDLLRNL